MLMKRHQRIAPLFADEFWGTQQLGTFHESPFASCLCQCLGHVRPVRQAFVDPADRLDGVHTEKVPVRQCRRDRGVRPKRSLAQAEVGHHDAEVVLRMLHAAGAFAHLPVEIVIDALRVFPIFPDGEGLSVVGRRGGEVLPFVVEHGGVARGGIAVEEPRFGGDERADRIAFAVEAAVSLHEQAAHQSLAARVGMGTDSGEVGHWQAGLPAGQLVGDDLEGRHEVAVAHDAFIQLVAVAQVEIEVHELRCVLEATFPEASHFCFHFLHTAAHFSSNISG